MDRTHDDEELTQLLATPRRIAVMGASPDPDRASHHITVFLRDQGHHVIPVNPMAPEVAGLPCAKNLEETVAIWGAPPELVDVFRAAHHLPMIVPEVIASGAPWLWLQLGVVHDEAIQLALDAGLELVADRCILVESKRLLA